MKVIISAGGTGGHIYPALAIIERLKKEEKSLELLYIGTHNRMEKDLIPNENIPYEELVIYGLSKNNLLRNIKNVFLIHKAYKKCLKIMNEFKPDVVIGVGGYVTYPVVKAAKRLGIKIFLHEQNSIPGKTNLALAKHADIIGVSFKKSFEYFKDNQRVVETGNPCGERAKSLRATSKTKLGFSKNKKLVVIVSGSLGSQTVNNKLKDFLKNSSHEKYEILFITGSSHYEAFMKNEVFPDNVKVKPFVNNLASLLKQTDLLVTRAGASTISEIIALKIPSILIPSPYVANNHQYYNALEIKEEDAGVLISESDLNSNSLKKEINKILYDSKRQKEIIKNLTNLGKYNSSELIYEIIKELAK
ncbi:MAG: undecaprenyldiphospho-muramoylpentapeptide beta-N-acetylglucosaminyltransferase [Mollicutes bacterium]|nr:undecaprenyldiphospho-muramoylpentapeptide beta-N-acetylglucosaminyltransferase [Mollicutes bacterium]